MRVHIVLLLAAALVTPAAKATDAPPVLTSLSSQLKALRTLPQGAKSSAACPENTKALVGLSQELIRRTLGEPDFVDPSKQFWSYFFTAPLPHGLLGGGFPQLNFTFSTASEVASVSCYYAR